MELDEYQKRAMETCMPSCMNLEYMGLNFGSESGELLGKIAKAVRKGEAILTDKGIEIKYNKEEVVNAIELEAGDVIWQIAGILTVIGSSLNAVAEKNLNKLSDRKQRGVIDGNGDYR